MFNATGSRDIQTSEMIELLIRIIRGQRVILDTDLAKLYQVPTKVLNQAVRRNKDKFPDDFMFQLTSADIRDNNMRSQFVTASKRNARHLPYAFTEHGAIMAANVLNSPMAVHMSVFVVRAFVRMRSLLSERKELVQELVLLEKKLTERLDIHEMAIVDVLKRLMEILDPPPSPPRSVKEPIGFH